MQNLHPEGSTHLPDVQFSKTTWPPASILTCPCVYPTCTSHNNESRGINNPTPVSHPGQHRDIQAYGVCKHSYGEIANILHHLSNERKETADKHRGIVPSIWKGHFQQPNESTLR
ncbi:hypothetical protein VTN77DRAFT_4638 [Rasamsonia byssochlamydoides]|uniref:uncharacterized protein n=1 Tax=Rasamsonia byssochlamydoides TaxID=89139 RepID=UPI00374239EC